MASSSGSRPPSMAHQPRTLNCSSCCWANHLLARRGSSRPSSSKCQPQRIDWASMCGQHDNRASAPYRRDDIIRYHQRYSEFIGGSGVIRFATKPGMALSNSWNRLSRKRCDNQLLHDAIIKMMHVQPVTCLIVERKLIRGEEITKIFLTHADNPALHGKL